MSLEEFIRLEARVLRTVKERDPNMVWQAIECGAADHMRLYAESRNYDVTFEEMVQLMWAELCFHASFRTSHVQ